MDGSDYSQWFARFDRRRHIRKEGLQRLPCAFPPVLWKETPETNDQGKDESDWVSMELEHVKHWVSVCVLIIMQWKVKHLGVRTQ